MNYQNYTFSFVYMIVKRGKQSATNCQANLECNGASVVWSKYVNGVETGLPHHNAMVISSYALECNVIQGQHMCVSMTIGT